MTKLYFMNRAFEGTSFPLDQAIEDRDIQLLFADSWYWLHYCFFNCRDMIGSDTSSALRTHLFNFAAMLYRSFEVLPEKLHRPEMDVAVLIAELNEIAEYSRAFPISLWIYGDDTSETFLKERVAALPTNEQIERLMELPHFLRTERERLSYRHDGEKVALKRVRNEEAAYNKRRKLAAKDRQREGK